MFLLIVLILSFCFAKLEIQIEGNAGWAKNLPTWRIEDHFLLKIFWGGRPLTGYHFWAMIFIFFAFHLPLAFIDVIDLKIEARIIGGFILFWALEDFLWFIMNPDFGLKKFQKKNIPWHPRWFLGLPVDYWLFFPLSLILIYYSFIG